MTQIIIKVTTAAFCCKCRARLNSTERNDPKHSHLLPHSPLSVVCDACAGKEEDEYGE